MRLGTIYRELRNSKGRLLCKVDDQSGMVEMKGLHNSYYEFSIPVGGSFTIARENITSRVIRTETTFDVEDTIDRRRGLQVDVRE